MSTTTSRLARRSAGALVASALSLSALAVISPAHADTGTWLAGGGSGAALTAVDAVAVGNTIHIEGTGWTDGTDDSDADGSWIGIKLGAAASGGESGILTTEPAAGKFAFPSPVGAFAQIWYGVVADDDGSFSVDVPFPTAANTSPALATEWATGTTHHLQLLTGSTKPTGDQARSTYVTFTVGAGLASSATAAADDKVTVKLSGGTFPAGEVLSVKQGGAARQWTVTSGRTSTVQDTLTVGADGSINASVVLPAGSAPAGAVTLTITGNQGTDQDVTVVAPPSVSFAKGIALGATGTLTLGNLPAGTKIASVKLGESTLASNLTADGTGAATAPYTIPTSLVPGQATLTVQQSAPSAATYTQTVTVLPDETVTNADKFTILKDPSDPAGDGGEDALFQGTYQSSYSAKEKALFVSAANNGTGAGAVYKLDPTTLAVLASATPTPASTTDPTGGVGAHGLGVDDVNGTVWTTNSRPYASLSVWSQTADADGHLTLLKQFPNNTVAHPRDVIYDPKTNYVFVSSASEGATGNGYIKVFEGGDNDGDGTKYEEVKTIQTGPRSAFNPVSLALENGTLVSPSLSSNSVAVIDTAKAVVSAQVAEGQVDSAVTLLEVGEHSTAGNGRGGSGIAYDAKDNRLFVASQNDNSVWVADATTGTVIKKVPTGQQALNVAHDPVNNLIYVTNFGGTTVTVLDPNGNVKAKLPIARANHVTVDNAGNAYVVDKATPVNHVWKITPKPAAPSTGNPQPKPPTVVHLTPAQQKIAKAQKKVAEAKTKVAALKASLKKAKHSALSKKAKAKKVKKLKKQLAKATKALTRQKKALAKAKKAGQRSHKKK